MPRLRTTLAAGGVRLFLSLTGVCMLVRASAKFRRQYSCALDKRDPPVQPFPQTWNLDVLSHGRSQLLVLASEEYTLFSLLVPTGRARNSESFLIPFRLRLLQLFENVRIR